MTLRTLHGMLYVVSCRTRFSTLYFAPMSDGGGERSLRRTFLPFQDWTMKLVIRFAILLVVLGIIYGWMKMVAMAPRRQRTTAPIAGTKEELRRTSITLDSFLHVQQLRKKQLRHFCDRFPQLRSMNSSVAAEHLLSSVSMSHKFMTLYCKPGDVTIDGWEELVEAMEARSDVTLRNPLPIDDSFAHNLAKFNPTILAKVLRTYAKVLFVGDPFERLVSLYMQGNAGEVSFQEFIEDILLMETGEGGISSSSVITLCYPCFVRYDYIVMVDFLPAELPHLLKRIGFPESVAPPPSIDQRIKASSRWLSDNLFRRLDRNQFRQLSRLYWWDFAAFPLRNRLIGIQTMGGNVS